MASLHWQDRIPLDGLSIATGYHPHRCLL